MGYLLDVFWATQSELGPSFNESSNPFHSIQERQSLSVKQHYVDGSIEICLQVAFHWCDFLFNFCDLEMNE